MAQDIHRYIGVGMHMHNRGHSDSGWWPRTTRHDGRRRRKRRPAINLLCPRLFLDFFGGMFTKQNWRGWWRHTKELLLYPRDLQSAMYTTETSAESDTIVARQLRRL